MQGAESWPATSLGKTFDGIVVKTVVGKVESEKLGPLTPHQLLNTYHIQPVSRKIEGVQLRKGS